MAVEVILLYHCWNHRCFFCKWESSCNGFVNLRAFFCALWYLIFVYLLTVVCFPEAQLILIFSQWTLYTWLFSFLYTGSNLTIAIQWSDKLMTKFILDDIIFMTGDCNVEMSSFTKMQKLAGVLLIVVRLHTYLWKWLKYYILASFLYESLYAFLNLHSAIDMYKVCSKVVNIVENLLYGFIKFNQQLIEKSTLEIQARLIRVIYMCTCSVT